MQRFGQLIIIDTHTHRAHTAHACVVTFFLQHTHTHTSLLVEAAQQTMMLTELVSWAAARLTQVGAVVVVVVVERERARNMKNATRETTYKTDEQVIRQ